MRYTLVSLRNILLLIGVLFATFTSFIAITNNVQVIIFFVVLMFTGIPHGSLDFYINKKISSTNHTHSSALKFFIKYLGNMLAYAICWYFFPIFSFLLFIVLTAYHFGEIDWQMHQSSLFNKLLFFVYGLITITYIITIHINDTANIINIVLNNFYTEQQLILWGNYLSIISIITITIYLVLIMAILPLLHYSKKAIYYFVVQSVLLFSIIYVMPFYIGFAFYFGCWHSFISFQYILKQLQLDATLKGWLMLFKLSVPYTIVAFLGIAIIVVFFSNIINQSTIISSMFIGIAMLTLPHLQVFTKLFQEKKQ